MPARYTSFVIRHWQLAGGARRIVVEHVQSGKERTVASLADALAWFAKQVDAAGSPDDEQPLADHEPTEDEPYP